MTKKDTLKMILGAYKGRIQEAEVRDAEMRICHHRIDLLTGALKNLVNLTKCVCEDSEIEVMCGELDAILSDSTIGPKLRQISEKSGFQRDQMHAEFERINALIEGLPDDD